MCTNTNPEPSEEFKAGYMIMHTYGTCQKIEKLLFSYYLLVTIAIYTCVFRIQNGQNVKILQFSESTENVKLNPCAIQCIFAPLVCFKNGAKNAKNAPNGWFLRFNTASYFPLRLPSKVEQNLRRIL